MRTYERLCPAAPQSPPFYYLGLDLGQASDFSALAIAERNRRPRYQDERDADGARYRLGHLQRWPLKTPYPSIVKDVAGMVRQLAERAPRPFLRLVVDGTGVGAPVVDLLRAEDLPAELITVTITGGDQPSRNWNAWRVPKRDLVSVVQVALQTERLKIAEQLPDARILTQELLNFQVKINVATAHDSYGAWREGEHDDLLLAAALAIYYGEEETLRPPPLPSVMSFQFGHPIGDFQPEPRIPWGERW